MAKRLKLNTNLVLLALLGISLLVVYSSQTGMFIGEILGSTQQQISTEMPQVFATANDVAYIAFPEWHNPGDTAVITSPDGRTLSITEAYASGFVAKIWFNGTVAYLMEPDTCQVPAYAILPTVVGNLVGAAVDGTWTIKNVAGDLLIPHMGAVRLEVQGKIFDDTNPSYEPLNGCPFINGNLVAGNPLVTPKTWNWHKQTAQRYDTYYNYLTVGSTPSTLNPEENPQYARFFTTQTVSQSAGVNLPTPTVYATSSDHVWVTLYGATTGVDTGAILVSPDLKTMKIKAINGGTVVAKVRFDGIVEQVLSRANCSQTLPLSHVQVEGGLIGAAVDGSWVLKKNFDLLGFPLGMKLNVQNKQYIHNFVDPAPNIVCGGNSISLLDPGYLHLWNWHVSGPSYDGAGLSTNTQESPANLKLFTVPLTVSVTAETCPASANANVDLSSSTHASASIGVKLVVNGQTYSSCGNQNLPVLSQTSYQGFESGILSSPFESSTWSVSSSAANIGSFSARSGLIDHNAESRLTMQTTLPESGVITFYRKASSEKGYDFLRFYIDGIKYDEWSGEKDWAEVSYVVGPGSHLFAWVYEKDAARSGGEDTAWIDDVKISETSLIDTDGDGYTNFSELKAGSDPLNPNSTPYTDDDGDGVPNHRDLLPNVCEICLIKNI